MLYFIVNICYICNFEQIVAGYTLTASLELDKPDDAFSVRQRYTSGGYYLDKNI